MSSQPRRRILLVAEGATLAHFAGAAALASALPPDAYEVCVACPEPYRQWLPEGVAWLPLETLPPSVAYARMATARPLYDRATLETYVRADRAILTEARPDLVIGDGRLSLAASAREAGVPYIALAYASWHPGQPWRPVLPCLRWTPWLPGPLLAPLQTAVGAIGRRWHAGPLAEMLRAHGVKGVDSDLRSVWTEADVTLYGDLPALFPGVVETSRRRFVGPIVWEPPVALPKWWDRLPGDRPIAYVTLGSSGITRPLGQLIEGLRRCDYTVVVATAARVAVEADGKRLFAAKYIPGAAACRRADLVVSNGGSLTTTQALLAGRPVLGICTNFDQFLHMRAVEQAGAGLALRADRVRPEHVAAAARRLEAPAFAQAAAGLMRSAVGLEPGPRLIAAIEALLQPAQGAGKAPLSAP